VGLLNGTRLLALDTETTGMSPRSGAALVEVASVALENGAIGESWSSLVNPGRPILPTRSAFTASATRWWRVRPSRRDRGAAARSVRRPAAGLPQRAVRSAVPARAHVPERAGPAPQSEWWTRWGSRAACTKAEATRSARSRARFGLPPQTAHRALGDALTTAHLFLLLTRRWEGEQVRSLDELAAVSQDVLRLTARR
jgi:hypothetical protein